MPQRTLLIRGGSIVSMDPAIGNLSGDLLLVDGRIDRVGPNQHAPDAEVIDAAGMIVLPGFVDTHRHTWQAAVPQADATEMIAFLQRVYTSSGILAISVGALLFPLAWLLAGIGLYRANTLPRWQASLIAAGLFVSFGAELAGAPKAVCIAADVAFVLGLAPLGVRVLGQSGRKWAAHPPAPAAPAAPTVG